LLEEGVFVDSGLCVELPEGDRDTDAESDMVTDIDAEGDTDGEEDGENETELVEEKELELVGLGDSCRVPLLLPLCVLVGITEVVEDTVAEVVGDSVDEAVTVDVGVVETVAVEECVGQTDTVEDSVGEDDGEILITGAAGSLTQIAFS
jgi:hypothetical protein